MVVLQICVGCVDAMPVVKSGATGALAFSCMRMGTARPDPKACLQSRNAMLASDTTCSEQRMSEFRIPAVHDHPSV